MYYMSLWTVSEIADVKASSYSVCPLLSIRDDKATNLMYSLMSLASVVI